LTYTGNKNSAQNQRINQHGKSYWLTTMKGIAYKYYADVAVRIKCDNSTLTMFEV
jgi:hypothetical protein